jgi:hypothetical protein
LSLFFTDPAHESGPAFFVRLRDACRDRARDKLIARVFCDYSCDDSELPRTHLECGLQAVAARDSAVDKPR